MDEWIDGWMDAVYELSMCKYLQSGNDTSMTAVLKKIQNSNQSPNLAFNSFFY